MQNVTSRIVASLAFLALVEAALAQTQLAEPLQPLIPVAYVIRHDPTDPGSAVDWTIDLTLKKVSASGNQVGWRVKSMEVSRFDAGGQVTSRWTKSLPAFTSPDGLWWVTHADPGNPQIAEFNALTLANGTAASQTVGGDPLNYVIASEPYVPPQGASPPYDGNVASLTFDFAVANQPPLDWGDDEPVEISDTTYPPYGS